MFDGVTRCGWRSDPLDDVTRSIENTSLRRRLACLSLLIATFAITTGWCVPRAAATPPEYQSFHREQRVTHASDARDLMRIWMVYVNQGDGILIQLPERCNYDSDPHDSDPEQTERVDILVDGGAVPPDDAFRLTDFLEALYVDHAPIIEHMVLTHHDQDHVAGATQLLAGTHFGVEHIYHNGLASYRAGAEGFPAQGRTSSPAVFDFVASTNQIRRGMAFVEGDGDTLSDQNLIVDLEALRQRAAGNEFQGVYEDLATAIVRKQFPRPVVSFDRAHAGGNFIAEREHQLARGVDLSTIRIEIVWPPVHGRQFGNRDWGETINGNSVTFRLVYRDFEMLFTGDQNEKSEKALLDDLRSIGQLDRLSCDVLKVPHHGSSHAYEPFFRDDHLRPVVSVASLGDKGFQSKLVNGTRAWQHPSTDVIEWLGGAHRAYLTHVHERKFDWTKIDTQPKQDALVERTHILIETDGEWFRVVEIPAVNGPLLAPPTVADTHRGDGTRWIRAR